MANTIHINTLQSFRGLITNLYFLVVKIEDLLEVLNVPKSYIQKNFAIFIKIRKWANFFKHPKAFIYAHHPTYVYENDPDFKSIVTGKERLYYKFIEKFYSSNDLDQNKALEKRVANKRNLALILPNIPEFIQEFSDKCNEFVNLTLQNPVYKDILTDKSTILDYYTLNSKKTE